MAQVLLQEQQINAEVVIERCDHAQTTEARQDLIRPEEAGALTRWSQGGVHNHRGEKHVHPQVDFAQQPKDAHGHELALDGRWHRAVVSQHACAQIAGELVGVRGQTDVVGEEDASQQEGQEGQTPADQVLRHEGARHTLCL